MDVAEEGSVAGQTWTLRQLLELPALSGAQVLAGESGLDRGVGRLSAGELPEVTTSTEAGQFFLMTAYPSPDDLESLEQIIVDADDADLSGLGIMFGGTTERPPVRLLELANERGLPVVQPAQGTSLDDILNGFLSAKLDRQAHQSGQREQIQNATATR